MIECLSNWGSLWHVCASWNKLSQLLRRLLSFMVKIFQSASGIIGPGACEGHQIREGFSKRILLSALLINLICHRFRFIFSVRKLAPDVQLLHWRANQSSSMQLARGFWKSLSAYLKSTRSAPQKLLTLSSSRCELCTGCCCHASWWSNTEDSFVRKRLHRWLALPLCFALSSVGCTF